MRFCNMGQAKGYTRPSLTPALARPRPAQQHAYRVVLGRPVSSTCIVFNLYVLGSLKIFMVECEKPFRYFNKRMLCV